MKKVAGVMLVVLLLGAMVATAGSVACATTTETQNESYEKFWEILDREAELVASVENGYTGLAPELIQNSRLGAENAANISALIWQAMEELKNSGIKTYYTAEELREMAHDISRNGLPQETVEALGAQGWTDGQIQALEEYIAKNADNINEDFNMTAFLYEFSTAFLDVAFKYNEYEAWALKKWKWKNPHGTLNELGDPLINPALADEWLDFYVGYSEGNYSKMESASEKLRDKMYDMIVGETLNKETLMQLKEGRDIWQLLERREDVRVIWWLENGGVVFSIYNSADNSSQLYYWSNATAAYELVSNIISLVKARNLGNNNPELQKMLNQKVAELKNALVALPVSTNNSISPVPLPDEPIKPIRQIKPPISPIDPVPPEPGLPIDPKLPPNPIVAPAESQSQDSITSYPTDTGLTVDDTVIREALDVNNNEGILHITGINVVVDSNQPGRVEYHVEVQMTTENNAVVNVEINVDDYTTGGSDSGSISFINVGESRTWNSKKFVYTHSSGGELNVNGKVEVTYTPSCGAVPNSRNPGTLSSPSSCDERIITRSYSATIDLKFQVDWSKVNVRLEASPDSVAEGESVTYRLIVENHQATAIEGIEYSVTIPISLTDTQTYSGTVDLAPDQSEVVFTKTVAYSEASTYTATASIYWNGHSKSTEKSVIVTSGTLTITGVDIRPEKPTHGDTVTFDVAIKNPISRSRTATVKLFIDGVEKSSKTITLGAGGSGTVSLSWTAQAGEHSWRIEVWEDGKLEASKSGSLEVSGTPTTLFDAELVVYPTELEGGGTVTFIVKVWNYDGGRVNVKGFVSDGDGVIVKDIDWTGVPASAQNYTITAFTLTVYGVGEHKYKLFLDNYDGQPNGKGEEHWSEVRVEVEPPSVQTAFMDCSDLVLSAERGNLILDMSCEVYFTNPTDVEWRITDVVTEARILKGQYTQEITPEFSDTLLTPTVPAKGTGRLQVNFHDTLPASGFLGKSVKIGDLAGVSVPVEVDLTLEVNGKTYVVDSQGNTWSLKYRAIKMVEISIEENKIVMDLSSELAIVGTTTAVGAVIGGLVGGPVGAVVGAVGGAVVGIILSYILHEYLGIP